MADEYNSASRTALAGELNALALVEDLLLSPRLLLPHVSVL
jgi:hypothetical protein